MEIGNLTSGVATEGVALIKDAQLKTTRTGDPFLALRFADRTGEISGNLWDATENQVAQFKAGVVVELAGQVETYQDQLQFRIQELRLASPEEGQPEDFVPRVTETDGELKDDLRPFLAAIHQVEWATIVNHLFKNTERPSLTSRRPRSTTTPWSVGWPFTPCRFCAWLKTFATSTRGSTGNSCTPAPFCTTWVR